MDIKDLKTPCYVIDEEKLKRNGEILLDVKQKTNCKILLAQKAFSAFSVYPLLSKYLDGTTASGLYEAKLGREEFKGEVHIFSPAYKEEDFEEILSICDHIVFNSFNQFDKYKQMVKKVGKSMGLRLNPEFSTQEGHAIYDPCAKGSRLGVTLSNFKDDEIELLDGFHFHTLCEQNSDDLWTTLKEVDKKFGSFIKGRKWLNFGGGHHITREDYDIQTLCDCIKFAQDKYGCEVYLEPGEAVALKAGYLVSEVLEIINNEIEIAILDASPSCHMPDVLEMPYRPPLKDGDMPNEKRYTYRLGGNTCLAGDIIGDYSFDEKLKIGDKLIFEDMAIYSMVKNNTFNGIPLPSILLMKKDKFEVIKTFNYLDFKNRLS